MNWPVKKIGDLAIGVTKGTTPSSVGYKIVKTGIPFLRVQNLDGGKINLNDTQFIDNNTNLALERSQILPGDVLVSIAGTIGRSAVVEAKAPAMNCNQAIAIVRLRDSLNPHYFSYWINSIDAEKQINLSKVTATIPNLSLRSIKELEIPLPPLSEQKRIAAILDKADAIRRKRQETIKLTEELIQSAFLDMFGDPVKNPKGWDKCSLKDLFDQFVDCPHSTPKYSSSETSFPCIRTSDLQNGYLDFSTTKYVNQEEYEFRTKRLILIEGDVLYSREGERLGMAAIVEKNMTPCLGQRMMVLRTNRKKATSGFAWSLMNSQNVYQQALSQVVGTTSPRVNVGDIKNFKVFGPPLDKQLAYEKIISIHKKFRAKLYRYLILSNNLFESLQQRAFSGELSNN